MSLEPQDEAFDYLATISHNGQTINLSYDRKKLAASTRSIPTPKRPTPVAKRPQATPVAPQQKATKPAATGSNSKPPVPAKTSSRRRTIISPK